MSTRAVRELEDRVVVTLRRLETRNAINAAIVRELRGVHVAPADKRSRLDSFLAGKRA